MMNLDVVLLGIRAARSSPGDDELRRLPYLKAFIYGRVSSQVQVKESRESIRDIAQLVLRARKDGYKSSLDPAAVERWLEQIQAGAAVTRVLEDGDIIVSCEDLGLSGSLAEDKRPGLAHLQRRIENGEVGAVYLTEGMSRLSRDRDLVLGYRLLKLLKEHQCRVRSGEGIYNPAIPRDWDYLAADVKESAEEMRKGGVRLRWRRALKAGEGRHVGAPVCPGYVVTIEGQQRDGAFIFGKWQLYPPHRRVVVAALEEVVRQGSLPQALRVLQARRLVFPFFPDELRYMETRSVLRFYHRDSTGYLFSYNTLKGLATNVALIGIWHWRDVLIQGNHDPAVPVDLFLQAYEIAVSTKPRGRAAYAEPMEWSKLLYCCNHDEPNRLTALNRPRRWICRAAYLRSGTACLQIADHLLTPPLTREFLACLDLTPHAAAVLEKLKSEVNQHDLQETQRRREEAAIVKRVANLERCLGSGDPEREEAYWRLIRDEKAKLDLVRRKPVPPSVSPVELEQVARFLENIDRAWPQYPSRLRNQLLTLLIDRVELQHDANRIRAVIVWKIGLRQEVNISRPTVNCSKEKHWQQEEDSLLKVMWPSLSREAILAALPGRTWAAMGERASKMKIKRQSPKGARHSLRRWTSEEKRILEKLYGKQADIGDIAQELRRSPAAVVRMAHVLGFSRPKELRYRRREPIGKSVINSLFHGTSSVFRRFSDKTTSTQVKPTFPWFALAFVILTLVHLGLEALPIRDTWYSLNNTFLKPGVTFLMAWAFTGIGFKVRVSMMRSVGLRAMFGGIIVALVAGGSALLLTKYFVVAR